MREDHFYFSNHKSLDMESYVRKIDTLEQLEKIFPPEFLDDDAHVGY